MELKEFIENFADQFDDTDSSEIQADTVFKELDEWSSLIALSVIAMVDEEYDVTIKGDDVRGSETVEDLFNIVKSRAYGIFGIQERADRRHCRRRSSECLQQPSSHRQGHDVERLFPRGIRGDNRSDGT